MLDLGHDLGVNAEMWETVERKAKLPERLRRDFFDPTGPTSISHECKRSFHRFYLRAAAIVRRESTLLGGYTLDVSRQGIGFLSPVQLFPLERVELQLPSGASYRLEIARCRRIDRDCFACGGRFVL
jgi:hypothetical protein